jgi:hypothetical protein
MLTPIGPTSVVSPAAVGSLALSRGGSISAEPRGRGQVFKLRFRRRAGGPQVVRYLGRDPILIEGLARELETLQRRRRRHQEARRLKALSSKILGLSKAILAPLLAAAGLHFHGLAIRRRRPQANAGFLPLALTTGARAARPQFRESLDAQAARTEVQSRDTQPASSRIVLRPDDRAEAKISPVATPSTRGSWEGRPTSVPADG